MARAFSVLYAPALARTARGAHPTGVRTLLVFAPLLLLAASCATYAGVTRSAFVSDATCPSDRVTVAHAPPPPPPPDVAADPGRLRVWRTEAAKRTKHRFVATGCGQTRRYFCDDEAEGTGRYAGNYVVCRPDQPFEVKVVVSSTRGRR
jgi:hypothetical protein